MIEQLSVLMTVSILLEKYSTLCLTRLNQDGICVLFWIKCILFHHIIKKIAEVIVIQNKSINLFSLIIKIIVCNFSAL